MADLLPAWPLLSAFIAASLLLAATPGPGVLYIVARSLSQGRASGLASVAGVAAGNFGNALGAALGLAALFALSSTAFTVVKWAGAAYLVWLGVRALRAAPPVAPAGPGAVAPMPLARVAREGFVVALLNPKTTVFFAAFLPQFMQPGGSAVAQSIALGAIFVAIAATTDALYALLAARVVPALGARSLRWRRWFSGGTCIGLGVLTALSDSAAQRQPR